MNLGSYFPKGTIIAAIDVVTQSTNGSLATADIGEFVIDNVTLPGNPRAQSCD